jgi:hypothetical protein
VSVIEYVLLGYTAVFMLSSIYMHWAERVRSYEIIARLNSLEDIIVELLGSEQKIQGERGKRDMFSGGSRSPYRKNVK